MRLKTKQKKSGMKLTRFLSTNSLPLKLKMELEDFAKRNSLEYSNTFCPQCLKAHAVRKAKELSLDKIAVKLSKTLGEIGHNGYYLDRTQLIEFNF